jgi:hypothetical protein
MEKRQIRMQDGRYLIFYTFAEKPPAPSRSDKQRGESRAERQVDAKPEAEEERGV